MLPATKTRRFSLADVMPSCLDAILGQPNSLSLPDVAKAVVVLVDGLGTHPLTARAGHSRTLAPLVNRGSTIDAVFPTTTAAALATVTTGTLPGQHGLVGYSVLDAANDRIVNQLRGWDDRMPPATWQRERTIFERATDDAVPAFVVASERYRDSGFTRAVLRGASYSAAATMAGRLSAAREILDTNNRAIVYVYIPELDVISHAQGSESPAWTIALEELDSAMAAFARTLKKDEGVLLTADHGVLDVPAHAHVDFDLIPGLLDGIRFVAGEPRCLQVYFEPGLSPDRRRAAVERWQSSEGDRSWVASRSEAIDGGLFGADVATEVLPRIGDIIVAARRRIAYYDTRASNQSGRKMVGQHGSLSAEETSIPLLRFGAFRN